MKRILICAVLLSACAQEPVLQPGPEVDIPIAVPCKHAALVKPAFPLQTLTANANVTQLLQSCLATDKLRQAYELECEAVVKACE